MLSPVWRAKLCRGSLFAAGTSRILHLGHSDATTFHHAVAVGCGAEVAIGCC